MSRDIFVVAQIQICTGRHLTVWALPCAVLDHLRDLRPFGRRKHFGFPVDLQGSIEMLFGSFQIVEFRIHATQLQQRLCLPG